MPTRTTCIRFRAWRPHFGEFSSARLIHKQFSKRPMHQALDQTCARAMERILSTTGGWSFEQPSKHVNILFAFSFSNPMREPQAQHATDAITKVGQPHNNRHERPALWEAPQGTPHTLRPRRLRSVRRIKDDRSTIQHDQLSLLACCSVGSLQRWGCLVHALGSCLAHPAPTSNASVESS